MPGSTQNSERYKWVVLSNTTLGVLMATIDMSIMLIALPAGPVSGLLSDRFGSRPFATGGMIAAATSFFLLEQLSIDFASGLHTAFDFAIVACLAAAGMSWLRGGKYHYREEAEPIPAQTTKAA